MLEAYILRPHDLVCLLTLEHTVLVYAALVRKCVFTHYSLVRLRLYSGYGRNEPACRIYLSGIDSGLYILEYVGPGLHRHYDLFEGGVSGTLTEPVYRTLHLPRAVHDAKERIGHRQTEVVVAVHRYDRPFTYMFVKLFDQCPHLLRKPVADRIGYV